MVLETPAGRAGTEAYAIELNKALLRVVTTLLLYFFFVTTRACARTTAYTITKCMSKNYSIYACL